MNNDPDTMLTELRTLARKARRSGSDDAKELANKFKQLDDWLAPPRKGFLPREWSAWEG